MPSEELSSWNNGPAKTAILGFVAGVTEEGGPDYVRPADRIATFDNDGTLWCEQPLQVQFSFARHRLNDMVARDPGLAQRQPFKAYVDQDMVAIKAAGMRGLFEVGAAAHAGITEDAFDQVARDWLAQAKHPSLGRLFTELVYVPQLELVAYLQKHGFQVFIVSGGGIDLMRAFSEEVYQIPRHHVIGSSVKTRFEIQEDVGQLVKLAELNTFDDREVKPCNIGLHIGRRPILAFGNSDGDLAMLRYTKTGPGPRLALLLHHDDGAREFAYDREFRLSPLAEALDNAPRYGIDVVSMKRDWGEVFAA